MNAIVRVLALTLLVPSVLAGQAPTGRNVAVSICVAHPGGKLENVSAQYNVQTGDTTIAGKAFTDVYPNFDRTLRDRSGYAPGLRHLALTKKWYMNQDTLAFGGARYVPVGLPRVLGTSGLTAVGAYDSVPLFVKRDQSGPPAAQSVYLILRNPCEFIQYERVGTR